jgi:hypothetical protein
MRTNVLKYSSTMLSGRRLAFCVFLLGCTKANPSATCDDGSCSDPNFPYCDVDGSVDGVPNECVAVSCTPGEIKECRSDSAFTCNAAGNGYELDPCGLGCSDSPTSHCKYLQPKYVPDICDTVASQPAFNVTSTGTFDPNLDSNCTGGVIDQPGAPSICVVRAGSIAFKTGVVMTVTGRGTTTGRSIAFVSDELLSVDGTIDVGAHNGVNGPGGGVVSVPIGGGGANANAIGTGGAGGATAGAAGGTSSTDGGGGDAGPAAMNPALLSGLVGGTSASRYTDPDSTPLGGGGGALLLVSCRAAVNIDGVVSSGGGGGMGGPVVFGSGGAGFGGGAGGSVVIEGANVAILGSLFANGGAGGSGVQSNLTPGNVGMDGVMSTSFAFGGTANNGAGEGGYGGYVAGSPGPGRHPTISGATAGGGGGSVGFLQIYTPNGVTPTLTPSAVSPALQPNGIVETR